MWNHSLRRRAAAGLALAVVLTSSTAALAAPPSEPAPGAYTTNGTVSAIAHASGRTYVGGDFTRVGPRSGAGVTLTANGALSAFPVRAEVAGGEVRAVVSDGAGGWYIGGSFTWVGGQRRLALARIRSDGTVDTTFAPAVADIAGNPGEVNALVLSRPGPDGARTLYVGGRFRQIRSGNDRTFHHNLAALDAGDGAERTFKVFIGGCQSSEPECSSAVRALALGYVALPVEGVSPDPPQPILFVAGDFTRIGVDIDPYTVAGLAAVRGIGSVGPTNLKTSGQVVAHFPAGADPVPVAWNPSPSSVYAMQAGEPAPPSASPTTSLVVYVGGQNTEKTAPVAKALQLQLNKSSHTATSTGVQFNSWRPAPVGCAGCAVRALALDGQRVYFGGDFDRIGTGAGQKPAGRLGKIAAIANAQDTSVSAAGEPLGPGVDGPVRALAWSAGRPADLMVAGDFTQGVLPLDTGSGTPSAGWAPPAPDASPLALGADPSTPSVYVGGAFGTVASVGRAGLAAFDASGGLLDWGPGVAASGYRPLVNALAASGTTVYVGGQFDGVGGRSRANLAAVDSSSGAVVEQFDPAVSKAVGRAGVLGLSLFGSTLYVGGVFDRVDGHDRAHLAAVDANSGDVSGWNPRVAGLDPVVRAILPACGAVYVGGLFHEVGGQVRQNIAAIDPATGLATPWDPEAHGKVRALARNGATIYAGGDFWRIGGWDSEKLAALSVEDGSASETFDADIDPRPGEASVRSLGVTDSTLYVGGAFVRAGGEQPVGNLAALDPLSGARTGWAPLADRPVEALTVGGDAVHVGGDFGAMGASAQRGIVAFGPGAGSPLAAGPCSSQRTDAATPAPSAPEAPPTPPGTPPTPPAVPRAALVGRASTSPATVRLAGRPLAVRFTLSRPGRVRLRFERLVAARCPARSPRPRSRRRCWRYVPFAAVTRLGRRGLNRVAFPGHRIGTRRLRPGGYRVTIAPVPTPRRGGTRVVRFRVVRA